MKKQLQQYDNTIASLETKMKSGVTVYADEIEQTEHISQALTHSIDMTNITNEKVLETCEDIVKRADGLMDYYVVKGWVE
jgi:uncharacterized protein (DUF2461 family)